MSCSTEVEYISIHERRRKPGRPRGSMYTEEEKKKILEKLAKNVTTIIMNIVPFNKNYLNRMFVE